MLLLKRGNNKRGLDGQYMLAFWTRPGFEDRGKHKK
jgi:hypothetical protein